MAKFWNFVFFQLGWFACVLGAANKEVLWPVLGALLYVCVDVWCSPAPKAEANLLVRALLFGVLADTLLLQLGLIHFGDAWPSPLLSPAWMWILWVLFATTIGRSLSWLRGQWILAAFLGAIAGPLSYEAGIRLGAAEWGPGGQITGLLALAIVWGIATPLFFYWDRTPLEQGRVKNP